MELFLKNPLFGLLHFDLLGMITYLLFIPFTLSLYRVLKEKTNTLRSLQRFCSLWELLSFMQPILPFPCFH